MPPPGVHADAAEIAQHVDHAVQHGRTALVATLGLVKNAPLNPGASKS
jgi:hypothetical protein